MDGINVGRIVGFDFNDCVVFEIDVVIEFDGEKFCKGSNY